MKTDLASLMKADGFLCPSCGRRHFGSLSDCLIGDGVLEKLPALLEKYGVKKPFVLCDRDTYAAAGARVAGILSGAGAEYALHIVERKKPAPDERIVGEAALWCPLDADAVIAVGSGVLNDTAKILAAHRHVPDLIVGTAPSMDGFGSGSSSMERGGLKVSMESKCPDAVIGEASVLASSPAHMIRSGIGDMLAKHVSIVEWKIAEVLVGDPFCGTVAGIVRDSLALCTASAKAAVGGDPDAVKKVMEGLVVSGLAMNYVGISRPASGMEHYISHILDMRALAFGTPSDLHGIQCGIGTLMTVRAYEKLKDLEPDREKALRHARAFDLSRWNDRLRAHLGEGAESMIRQEEKEGKYDLEKHERRLELILKNWERLLGFIGELPSSDELEEFMKSIGHPTSYAEIGVSVADERAAFVMAKDIRDKYVLGRLLWDLGELNEEGE